MISRLLLFAVLLLALSGNINAISCSVPASLSGITINAIPINIINSQVTATTTGYSQRLSFPASTYKAVLNGSLSNIYVFNGVGSYTVNALIMGNTLNPLAQTFNTANTVTIYVKLPEVFTGTDPNYCIGIASLGTVFFSNTVAKIGITLPLSNNNVAYDTGTSVFPNYWNFAGTSLPAGINMMLYAGSPTGSIVVDNSVKITGGNTAGAGIRGFTVLNSISFPQVYEFTGQQTSSPASDSWGWNYDGFSECGTTKGSCNTPTTAGNYIACDFESGINAKCQEKYLSGTNSSAGMTWNGNYVIDSNAHRWTYTYDTTNNFVMVDYDSTLVPGNFIGTNNLNNYPLMRFQISVGNNEGTYAPNGQTIYNLYTYLNPPNDIMPSQNYGALQYEASTSSTSTTSTTSTSSTTVSSTTSTLTTTIAYTYFNENGLPRGTIWNVTYNGILNTSVPTLSWTATNAYPLTIDDHACGALNGYAYCVAGSTGGAGVTNSVYYSQLLPNGGTTTWTKSTDYPMAFYDSSCVINSPTNSIVCVGGINSGTVYNSVYFAPLSASGVGTWTASNAYPLKFQNHICVNYNNNVYCIGGNVGGVDTANVYYATMLPTGGVTTWTATNTYPTVVDDSTCSASKGYIYCTAGSNMAGAGGVYNAVYSAQILGNNALGAWTATTPYPTTIYDHTCSIFSGELYCSGGYVTSSTSSITGNVFTAFTAGGTVGTWYPMQSYPLTVRSNYAFTSNGYLYIVGGYYDPTSTTFNNVYFTNMSTNTISFSNGAGSPSYAIANQVVNGTTYFPSIQSGTLAAGSNLMVTFSSGSTTTSTTTSTSTSTSTSSTSTTTSFLSSTSTTSTSTTSISTTIAPTSTVVTTAMTTMAIADLALPTNVNDTAGLLGWANTAVGGNFGIGIDVALFIIILIGAFLATGSIEAGLIFGGSICTVVALGLQGLGIAPSYLMFIFMGTAALGFVLAMTRKSGSIY